MSKRSVTTITNTPNSTKVTSRTEDSLRSYMCSCAWCTDRCVYRIARVRQRNTWCVPVSTMASRPAHLHAHVVRAKRIAVCGIHEATTSSDDLKR